MSEDNIKAIPYGVTDYEAIRLENLYYVDKTMYLRKVEKVGKYLFFIRPRRFGKSLFLSVMESYFDVYYKDRFEEFFNGTWIYENPTDQRGKYLVLSLNFSAVVPNPKRLEASFLNNIQTKVGAFLKKYSDYLDPEEKQEFREELKSIKSAEDIVLKLTNLCKTSKQKLYIIIDEYDNFANTILTTSGNSAYEDLTRGEGFFRSFFNFLKEATTGTGAPISRLFITGVSPVTLDDVTSGFNIGKNISIEADFNEMLGFTEKEVTEMIEYYRENGKLEDSTPYLMGIMNSWYNNYCFSKWADTRLFNSDMVLYFIDKCIRTRHLPDNLIDRNVRIDYGKLRHLIMVDSEKGRLPNGNFD
ncbi:MAG: AAA family ATPase, partial [bacterium]|nr:AAA family ATPase [bacterium]